MYNDIEQVINDNLTLKKAYQVAKNHSENLSIENKQLNEKYKDLRQNMEIITDQNNKLHERNKSLLAQINNNNASFVSQIEQLKSLIEQKQNQLQNFQLKLIPSLDQDMIRVKLIAEMEGPYQQQVDKKDREISKLKDHIHELKRQKQIIEFSLNNKERDLKKQIQQLRNYYISEIDRLTRQIAHMSQKSSTGKTEKQILKSYRLEIDQLRSTCQFHKSIEQQLRKQLAALRFEREKLLAELANKNAQKAIQLRQNANDGQIKELKSNIIRLEDQLQRIREQLQRSKTKIKNLENQKKKIESQYENQMRDMKINWEKQRQAYRNQIMDYKEQVRRYRQQSKRLEDQSHEVRKKYQHAVSIQERLTQENASLKMRINAFQSTQYSSHRDKRQRTQRQLRQKIQRQLTIKIREQIISEFNKKKQPWTPKKQDPPRQDPRPTPKPNPYKPDPYSPNRQQNFDPNTKEKTIRVLQEKIRKLTLKLEFANKKILQLIRQKAQRSDKITIQQRRNRSISSPQHDYNAILLQHRDCSFIPLCPPVIMEQIDHHRFIDPFRPI